MIKIQDWKEFQLDKLFDIRAGNYYYSHEYEEGNTPYVSASNANNGIQQRINLKPDFEGNCIVTGKVGCTAFYQSEAFCATSDVNIFRAKNFEMNRKIGLFIVSIINYSENYKWNYGRQCRVGDSKKIKIKLPAIKNNNNFVIDKDNMFSDEGFIPDFEWIMDFMEVVETRERESFGSIRDSIVTNNKSNPNKSIDVSNWRNFKLSELFNVKYGINIDLNKCIETKRQDTLSVNYVSRTSENNGVTARVKLISGKEPQPAGIITCAGGGSVLSTFLQNEPFYSGRDLYLLIPKYEMSTEVKMFLITIIEANKYRYNYGRQANITLPYLELRLPFRNNQPDWKYMHDYIKNLPYGDKLY